MRLYDGKVQLLTIAGHHLRFLPGDVAACMVKTGSAAVASQNGKIRSIKLISSAATRAQMIGAATGRRGGGSHSA